jgi:hypothetical protein
MTLFCVPKDDLTLFERKIPRGSYKYTEQSRKKNSVLRRILLCGNPYGKDVIAHEDFCRRFTSYIVYELEVNIPEDSHIDFSRYCVRYPDLPILARSRNSEGTNYIVMGFTSKADVFAFALGLPGKVVS